MTVTYVGGLRHRLIHDSVVNMVNDSLHALGWFDLTVYNGGTRQHHPVTIVAEQVPWDQQVDLNTIAISSTSSSDTDLELGSNLTEDSNQFYIDLYAEDEAVGQHLIGDIRDILRGKFPAIGRTGPVVDIYDYTQATPPKLFYCYIEKLRLDRAQNFPHEWQRYWFVLQFIVCDEYLDADAG